MGEVYRARDPRLGRDVAIKVLPADRVADEGRRRRFVQEAQAASALNHPHIITIHEIDTADGSRFHRDGVRARQERRCADPTAGHAPQRRAADRHPRRRRPRGRARARHHPSRSQTRQCDGRDRRRGEGARLRLGQTGWSRRGRRTRRRPPSPRMAPSARLARVAGTAAYMSPEQATGGAVDARSDIFSFGAMLYEMVTGPRAFAGKSAADTLAAVCARHPKPPSDDRAAIPETTRADHPAVPAEGAGTDAFSTCVDVKIELQEVEGGVESAGSARHRRGRDKRRTWRRWADVGCWQRPNRGGGRRRRAAAPVAAAAPPARRRAAHVGTAGRRRQLLARRHADRVRVGWR